MTCLLLIDLQPVDQTLKCRIDLRHFFKGNAGDLKALTGGNVNRAITIGFRNFLNLPEILGIQMSTWDTDAGGGHAALLGDAECVLFPCFCVDIHGTPPQSTRNFPLV